MQLRNFDGNPLSCVCQNKWIQETILYQKNNNFFPSFDARIWPKITTVYDDLNKLTCFDVLQSHHQPHSLMTYSFGNNCGTVVCICFKKIFITFTNFEFSVVPLIVFNETQEFFKKNEKESLSVMCHARGEPKPLVFSNF